MINKSEKKKLSRIVKQKMSIPTGVSYSREEGFLSFKGPEGEVTISFPKDIVINRELEDISLFSDTLSMAVLGTFVVLFKNAMNGVHKKFEKVMNLYGVGYKVLASNGQLEFFVGYSHSIKLTVPSGISFEVKTPTQVILKSCSKSKLGDFAAKISKLRKVNPYKTKGIIEQGAFILKKEGKK